MTRLLALVLAVAATTAWAADPKVHPERGQDAATQDADEAACHASAVSASGYDPANPPPVAQPAPVTGSGARVRGAAAGATVAAIGDNDTSDGAAKGAVVGGVAQRRRNRAAAAQQNRQAQAGADAYAASRKV
jgi:hypothetical protein